MRAHDPSRHRPAGGELAFLKRMPDTSLIVEKSRGEPDEGRPGDTTRRRIPSLDGLRAVSILLVILSHWETGAPRVIQMCGVFGVQIFFVISGFLITRLLQREYERSGTVDLLAFYRRRAVRIFPAAFVYIAVISLYAYQTVRPDLPFALTYTMSYRLHPASGLFGHLWSLSVEEQFYLLWPLALLLNFRNRGRVAMLTLALSAIFRLQCSFANPEYAARLLHRYFPSVMDSIAAGCLLAIYWPQVAKFCGGLARNTVFALSVPATAALLAYAFWRNTLPGDEIFVRPMLVPLWGIVPLLLALFVFVAVERRDYILNNTVAQTIGVLSYSLYLWQEPFTVGRSPSLALAAGLVAFTCLSYAFVEAPMLKLGGTLNWPLRRLHVSQAAR